MQEPIRLSPYAILQHLTHLGRGAHLPAGTVIALEPMDDSPFEGKTETKEPWAGFGTLPPFLDCGVSSCRYMAQCCAPPYPGCASDCAV
ncbi:hypothetical protein GDO81_028917 [Engystomops pustulosus]|uniref:Uncharacterized protein n=1 Tax=Engystomops pustulosus TaxID=76066 RepID=A0AAV6YDK9_ENGPU|nr:hypothetical protein GDO81_028917 [Engystomops pustulosus]